MSEMPSRAPFDPRDPQEQRMRTRAQRLRLHPDTRWQGAQGRMWHRKESGEKSALPDISVFSLLMLALLVSAGAVSLFVGVMLLGEWLLSASIKQQGGSSLRVLPGCDDSIGSSGCSISPRQRCPSGMRYSGEFWDGRQQCMRDTPTIPPREMSGGARGVHVSGNENVRFFNNIFSTNTPAVPAE